MGEKTIKKVREGGGWGGVGVGVRNKIQNSGITTSPSSTEGRRKEWGTPPHVEKEVHRTSTIKPQESGRADVARFKSGVPEGVKHHNT